MISTLINNSNLVDYGNGNGELSGFYNDCEISVQWFGKNDTRLFVLKDGFQIYAHRVDGIKDGIERGIREANNF